jgi:hypothetical protein
LHHALKKVRSGIFGHAWQGRHFPGGYLNNTLKLVDQHSPGMRLGFEEQNFPGAPVISPRVLK